MSHKSVYRCICYSSRGPERRSKNFERPSGLPSQPRLTRWKWNPAVRITKTRKFENTKACGKKKILKIYQNELPVFSCFRVFVILISLPRKLALPSLPTFGITSPGFRYGLGCLLAGSVTLDGVFPLDKSAAEVAKTARQGRRAMAQWMATSCTC